MKPAYCYCPHGPCDEYQTQGLCCRYQNHNQEFPERFGNLVPMPAGYSVIWVEGCEHFIWVLRDSNTNEIVAESVITCNRYDARRGAFAHAETEGGEHG